jgi:hypothetical protein
MISRSRLATLPLSVLLSLACLVWLKMDSVHAGDLNVQALLVWGTNEEKPPDKQLKELTAELLKKLRGVFKWRNYFEVNRQKVVLPEKGSKKTRLSDKCEIEIEHFGGADIEVRVIGQGKLFGKVRETISAGKSVVVAGDDKRDTAWFVVVTLTPQ